MNEARPVGAEYGEGFEVFRADNNVFLDVATLNEQLQMAGAERMRVRTIAPDEQHGMVFEFENVLCDTISLQRQAWAQLAEEEGFSLPSHERIAMYSMRPERVITSVLHWTQDWGRVQGMAYRVASIYASLFLSSNVVKPGVRTWLEALTDNKVPCAVVTQMDRSSLREVLDRVGLSGMFAAEVTCDDGMENQAQSLLTASLKLGRPPADCVLFTASPQGITAAHNCTMRAVAVAGAYTHYQLKVADVTVAAPDELTVYNVRRLFSDNGTAFMDKKLQVASQGPGKKRGTTNATL